MTRKHMAEMVMEASDVDGATGGTTGVVGGAREVSSGIGVAGAGNTNFVGSSSCYACSTYGGTGGAGLSGAPKGVE